jgi:hypothetical protein
MMMSGSAAAGVPRLCTISLTAKDSSYFSVFNFQGASLRLVWQKFGTDEVPTPA